ncbi:transcriptional regulator [Cellulosilyticum sp. ST5]|uniref:transcriptional regulator n=1 Tax=Cellulosilyticum sp. ST5 TaxID=3055805 RepID=UPI00397776D7
MGGWVRLHRKLLSSSVFENEKLLKVFIWCLLKASHKERDQVVGLNTIELTPGQFVTGRKKAASELGLKESTTDNYLKALEKLKIISMKMNSKYRVVTIENWELYQSKDEDVDSKATADEQQIDNKVTANKQQVDTNKNVKNVKKEKNNNNVHFDAECEKIWSLYPNKKGKAQAIAKLPKLIEQYGYDAIEKCVIAYANECKGKDIKYVKHGSTFFNGGYLDYLQIEAQEESSTPTKGPYIDEETGEIIRR